MQRHDVRFASGTQMCAGWLYEPDSAQTPGPLIVMAHGLGAVKEMGLDAFARRFVAEGYRALVFDYRHFGGSEGIPRELLDIGRQLDDWAAAIHYVRLLDNVDAGRIVLWGTSFSGGHVIEVAKRDGEVAAVMSQCPFTDGFASLRTLGIVSLLKVTVLAVRDTIAALRHSTPVRVALVGTRGQAALVTAPGAVSAYYALVPDDMVLPDQVTARIGMRIPLYYPGRAAADLTMPALFCVCLQDRVAPAKTTLWHVRKARHGQIQRYTTGHFDIYFGEWFERVISDQIAFLQSHVPVTR
ncbi:MAG: alpha/beta hydrolase [Propionibacteriales bacterium]|nr:alpha/beta hydrolase [Propionibacteriales bacterium]